MTKTRIAAPWPRFPRIPRLPAVLPTWLCLVSLTFAPVPLAAATLTLGSDSTTVTPGQTVTITATVSGLTAAAAPSLGTFDVALSFDPALIVLSGNDVTFSDSLGSIGGGEAAPFIVSEDGVLEVAALSVLTAAQLDALQGDSFQLFEAELRVLGTEPITVTMSASAFGDGVGNSLSLDPIAPLSLDIVEGIIFADGFEGGTADAWDNSTP